MGRDLPGDPGEFRMLKTVINIELSTASSVLCLLQANKSELAESWCFEEILAPVCFSLQKGEGFSSGSDGEEAACNKED